MKRIAVAVALMVAGCEFDARFDGDYRCDDDHPCPDGVACGADGFCEGGDRDGGSGGDGDGGGPEACGTTDALRDDFSDPEETYRRFTCSGPIAVAGEHLRADLPSKDSAYGECVSLRQYLMSDSELTLDVETSSDEVEAILAISLASGAEYLVVLFEGTLRFVRVEDDDYDTIYDEPYDDASDARWRLRQVDGELRFETAAAGGDFVHRASSDADEWPAYVTVRVSGWGPEGRASDGEVSFGPVNTGSSATLCAASSLVDDFSAGAAAEARWSTLGPTPPCTQERTDGVVRLSSIGGLDHCGFGSRMGYDLSDDAISIEAVDTGDGNPSLQFEVVSSDGRWYHLRVSGSPTNLSAESGGGGMGGNTFTDDYAGAAHRFWRIRHDGSSIYFEVSADGADWDVFHEREGVLPPRDVQVQMWVQSLVALDPSVLELDNLNTPR